MRSDPPSTALDHDAWSPWHPKELAHRLAGVARPWCIVGGWALDLWHGYQTRDHEDLEFTILRTDFGTFRSALAELEFHTAGSGIVTYLPPYENPPANIAQIWCQDTAARRWRVDMMIEPGTPETWIYKRDPEVFRPRADIVSTTQDGIPYLKPAAVLLFKARYRRDKDETDFEKAVPKLTAQDRTWLKTCLDRTHPGHDWARVLQE
jgi:hypothetical protein